MHMRADHDLQLAYFAFEPERDRLELRSCSWANLGPLSAAVVSLVLASLVVMRFPDSSRTLLFSLPGFGHERAAAADGSVTRVAIFGDSTALSLRFGFMHWAADHDNVEMVDGSSPLGCSILGTSLVERTRRDGGNWQALMRGGGPRIGRENLEAGVHESCLDINEEARESIESVEPDLAVVLVGMWEIAGVWHPNDRRLHTLGDRPVDDAMRVAIEDTVDLLSAHGALVVPLVSGRRVSGW